jgi:hypothetical protein
VAPLFWVSAVLSGLGGFVLAIIAAAGITTIPLWAVAIVAGVFGFTVGIGLGCAIVATENAT